MGNEGSNDGDGIPEMVALRSAVLRLACDPGPDSERLANRIVSDVVDFRWRGQTRREQESRAIHDLGNWLCSQGKPPVRRYCKHRAVESKATHGPYLGPLYGRLNVTARGGTTRTDLCRCGAKRYTNLNHGKQEFGRWHEQLELKLNQESDAKKQQMIDERRSQMTLDDLLTKLGEPSAESRRRQFRVV